MVDKENKGVFFRLSLILSLILTTVVAGYKSFIPKEPSQKNEDSYVKRAEEAPSESREEDELPAVVQEKEPQTSPDTLIRDLKPEDFPSLRGEDFYDKVRKTVDLIWNILADAHKKNKKPVIFMPEEHYHDGNLPLHIITVLVTKEFATQNNIDMKSVVMAVECREDYLPEVLGKKPSHKEENGYYILNVANQAGLTIAPIDYNGEIFDPEEPENMKIRDRHMTKEIIKLMRKDFSIVVVDIGAAHSNILEPIRKAASGDYDFRTVYAICESDMLEAIKAFKERLGDVDQDNLKVENVPQVMELLNGTRVSFGEYFSRENGGPEKGEADFSWERIDKVKRVVEQYFESKRSWRSREQDRTSGEHTHGR